jgi:enamine deaminase RidA (YjgF/YER057c/UK114 family)
MPTSNFIAHNPATLWQVPDAFRSVYSHAAEIAAPNLLFISGQFGVAPDGRLPADFAAQCQRAMDNVEPLLAAAGMTTANIVKLTITRRRRLISRAWCRSGGGAGPWTLRRR